ncbi:MAG: pyruvate ferredoxin oxidoreductase [Actinobacteria bacterium]|nr:MAG: pyruvate ferredoxin oxidoreductase [Actinomycetota bacterium]
MANIKELAAREEALTGGHRLCAGCGAGIAVRQVLMASKYPVVVASATGCLEVSTTIYPYTAWRPSFIHSAFENAAATISGVEAAYVALRRKGKLEQEYRFVAFGGDGGTYDIGLQALSGAAERGHKMVYVCYDNGAYMNTGIQRSSATPLGAWTTTTPIGGEQQGKLQYRKDLTSIMAAHNIPYVAQASVSNWNDLIKKAEKAFEADGPAFLNILAPCPRGWRYPSGETIQLAKLAVQTGFWPVYEVENGQLRVTVKVRERKPLVEFLKAQGRFKHMLKPENEKLLAASQEWVDRQWERIESLAG